MITSCITNREAVAIAMQKSKPKKRYNSLSEFRDYLEANNLETVLSFTGYELVYAEPRGPKQ